MKQSNTSNLMWFPRGTTSAVSFLLMAAMLELTVHRIALYFHKPSHELAEIPGRFKFLLPFATFSLYLLEILSFFLLLFFALHLLRINISSRARRIVLGFSIFFALPVLAINGILIPTHSMGYLLWYYLCALTMMILIGYSIWLQAAEHHSYRVLALWYLLLSPSLLLLSARAIHPQAVGFDTSHDVARLLIRIANYVFIFQGFLWPVLALRKGQRVSPLILLLSLLPPLALALWLRTNPTYAATVIYGGFRINLPLRLSYKLLFFFSFWASSYTICTLLARPRWDRILGMSLFLWYILGLSPYTEVEILPYTLLFLLLLLSLSLRYPDKPIKRFSKLSGKKWSEALGIPGIKARRQGALVVLRGRHDSAPFTVTLKKSLLRGKVTAYSITMGQAGEHDPDWVATSLPYIPIGRHLFPGLPRILTIGGQPIGGYGLWDRNFFSDSIVTQELNIAMERHLDGEVRIWYGSGITYESPHPPPAAAELKNTFRLVATLASRAMVS